MVQVTRTVAEVRDAVRAARRAGRRIGLVPTMGYLHEGHLSLIRRAAKDCDEVIVSVFVNPTQFNDAADLLAYPRDEERDVELAGSAGATMVFAPPVEEVYPRRVRHHHRVRAGRSPRRSKVPCAAPSTSGASPPSSPSCSGWCSPTSRTSARRTPSSASSSPVWSPTSTCLSSSSSARRCARTTDSRCRAATCASRGDDRERALALVEGLDAADAAVRAGETDAAEVERVATKAMLARGVGADYVAVVDPTTLAPLERIDGRALLVVAAHVGPVRLIDNAYLCRH